MDGRRTLRRQIRRYLRWLQGPGRLVDPERQQRHFTFLRLRFNLALSQLDLFSDVVTQRSEHDTGVWLSGLDVAAQDALRLPTTLPPSPPIVCYLHRGLGGAIRRARTRLPGGGSNPVAVIRIPRERMIGYGIASSLVHEVGHQAAALLDLVASLRIDIRRAGDGATGIDATAWRLWERWISEIVADVWSISRVGVASSMGLIGLVSLPRAFVFRIGVNDPHPFAWIRVQLSCALGDAMYPHPQWRRLARVWSSFYPTRGLPARPGRPRRGAHAHHAGLHRGGPRPSTEGAAWPCPGGGPADSRPYPTAAGRPVPCLATRSAPRPADTTQPGVRGHRPGAGAGRAHPGAGGRPARPTHHVLGARQHPPGEPADRRRRRRQPGRHPMDGRQRADRPSDERGRPETPTDTRRRPRTAGPSDHDTHAQDCKTGHPSVQRTLRPASLTGGTDHDSE